MACGYSGCVVAGRRRMLLVLALIVGVLGMHALVVLPSAAGHRMPSPVVTAPAVADNGAVHIATAVHDGTAPAAAAGVQLVSDHPGPGGGHGSSPSHHVLHLCLAILAALVVLGMAALALWPLQRPDRHEVAIGALTGRAPRRRPPPTSVRLAQLCVLRN